MNALDRAIEIAAEAHAGQVDKAGKPYILHPLRLMFSFQSENEMIVAVLHDVIEDSAFTIEDLVNRGFSEAVVEALACLTKQKGEDYENFISRVAKNDLARKIKIEDIRDNMDLSRLEKINEADLSRVEKYHRALRVLINRDKVKN